MSSELVERLLDWPYQGETMAHDAADHIVALTAERDRLRAAILFWLEAQEPDVDAAIALMHTALKGETT